MDPISTTSASTISNTKPPAPGCYNSLQRQKLEHPLSRRKKLAIQLLLQGHSDQQTADRIGVHRTTITRWRLYHPTFQTELNRQRQALWLNHADRLRSLMAKALDTLQSHLGSESERASFRAAVSLLRLGQRTTPSGPTDEYELLKQHLLHENLERNHVISQSRDWPPPKEELDSLRQYLLKKSANQPLQPEKPASAARCIPRHPPQENTATPFPSTS